MSFFNSQEIKKEIINWFVRKENMMKYLIYKEPLSSDLNKIYYICKLRDEIKVGD